MSTFGTLLQRHGISVPGHLKADAEVPVLTGPQAQGDVGVFPISETTRTNFVAVPQGGIQIVRGEASRRTHWLDGEGDVTFAIAEQFDGSVLLGELIVGDDSTAWLTHEDEHGCNAMGPGAYALQGKRQLADEIRRVSD